MRIPGRFFSAVLLICAGTAAVAFSACGSDDSEPETTTTVTEASVADERVIVPRVIGMSRLAAEHKLGAAGLDVAFERAHSKAKAGKVIAQRPAAGTEVSPTRLVTVTISKGPKPVPKPKPEPAPEPAGGPYGILGTSAIGPVKIGMTEDEVRALFGEPHEVTTVNLGDGPAPQISWTWNLQGGDVILKFATATGQLAQYHVTTPVLATASGVRVSDSIAPILQRYGDQLQPGPFGDSLVLSENEPGSQPALVFYLEGETITNITGGDIFQPAGE